MRAARHGRRTLGRPAELDIVSGKVAPARHNQASVEVRCSCTQERIRPRFRIAAAREGGHKRRTMALPSRWAGLRNRHHVATAGYERGGGGLAQVEPNRISLGTRALASHSLRGPHSLSVSGRKENNFPEESPKCHGTKEGRRVAKEVGRVPRGLHAQAITQARAAHLDGKNTRGQLGTTHNLPQTCGALRWWSALRISPL